jgi:serine/threonine protein kinase/Tfp pilus assembly protein PilF
MTPKRWEEIGEVYHAALELAPEERAGFLEQACAGDEELRREVDSLIEANQNAGEFIAAPVLKDAAQMLASIQNPAPKNASLIGRTIGHYRVIERLGEGGMGEVYLALDLKLNRQVSLKVLPTAYTNDRHWVKRFEREARTVSALNHPNILTIHEIGKHDDIHFLVTEFVDGQTLRKLMAEGALTLPDAVDAASQIAGALIAAHSAGIVHRDIKPENVMLRRDGLVKVLDFGLAKGAEITPPARLEFATDAPVEFRSNTEPGVVLGTPRYMSPEQTRGLALDARSDLFSLGVMLYEMAAGRPPFTGETPTDLILAIVARDPAPLDQHPEIDRIVRKALNKDREERYQTAREMFQELKSLQSTLGHDRSQNHLTLPNERSEQRKTLKATPIATTGVETTTTAASNAFSEWIRKRRAVVAAALIAAAFATGVLLYNSRNPVLTERDAVLLADLENKTGDEVFDDTLRQVLSVQLEQTPFLNLFNDDRVREALRYMGRPPDARLTREIAREIAQRQGLKAILTGSITRLDRSYTIILETINSQTGETVASALAEAEGKDQVMAALGRAAKQMREQLGESLASIKKFDAPPEQATTSSLEALKAWSRGMALARAGREEAVPLYKHAVALDPNFAKAYVSLSLIYVYGEQTELAAETASKAFALKDRVTEREKLDIAANYYAIVEGDLLKAIESLELWKQTYPRDQSPSNRLASFYRLVGRLEKSLDSAREAMQINPRSYVPHVSQGTALVQLDRFDEARAVIDRAISERLGTATSRRDLYYIGVVKGDEAMMKNQVDWASDRSEQYWGPYWQAQRASFAGRLREAEQFYARAGSLIPPSYPERAAWFAEETLLRAAACGRCSSLSAPRNDRSEFLRVRLQPYIPVPVSRGLALSMCRETGAALVLTLEIEKANPQSTLARELWLPTLRAAVELGRGAPVTAIKSLQSTTAYESAAMFWPNYLRAQARLALSDGAQAAQEFQKIIDHRGWDPASPLWPLAYLGLARANAMIGDPEASRRAYRTFLSLWKDADHDLPILAAAQNQFGSQ